MGTSSSNRGPKSKSDLLPTWFNDLLDTPPNPPEEQETPDIAEPPENSVPPEVPSPDPISPNESGNWGAAKGALTRAVGGTRGASIKKAAKGYMRALGGARKAARAAKRGASAARGLVSFLGSASAGGLNQALIDVGLTDCIGQPSEVVLARLADKLSPVGDTLDDAIARDAMIATLDNLYTKALENTGNDSALEQLSATTLKDAVLEYVSCFIFKKWVHELGLAIERNAVTEHEAIRLEKEMREFIQEEVKVKMSTNAIEQLDPSSSNNQEIIQNIFQIAYSILES